MFVAAHTRLPGKVAVKVLHGSFLRDRDSLARFRTEAEILAGLQHPNVVRVLDYNVSEGGVPYLVMELLGGVELRECIGPARGPQPPAWVAGIVRQVASALRSAHLKGIVHRDIKPENIMVLSGEGEPDFVKVLDFGVSNVSRARRRQRAPRRNRPRAPSPDGADDRRDAGLHAARTAAAGARWMIGPISSRWRRSPGSCWPGGRRSWPTTTGRCCGRS